jgi:3-oxoacyl-(acyl-carrier-protein) synthase
MTCVGEGIDTLWRAAEDGVSGVKEGLGLVPATTHDPGGRAKQLSQLTLAQAMRSAGWQSLTNRDGLILATTTGQIPIWDQALTSYLKNTLPLEDFISAFEHQPLGNLLQSLCEKMDFNGRRLLVTSACSASTQALAMAAMWLEQGLVDRCVVGGVEVLCNLTVQGFSSLQLLSKHASKPFDAYRSGINLSEGAAFICLEKEKSPRAQARLSGYGMSSDGYHMTAPHPEGKGCFQAMSTALNVAKISARDIDWIHAHGTGSTHNDLSEATAIKMLFGEGAQSPWVSSTKWVHGHALGASGIIESAICIEALKRGTILKTHGLDQPDSHLSLRHPAANMQTNLRHIVKNTLGFGGTNAALVWSQA